MAETKPSGVKKTSRNHKQAGPMIAIGILVLVVAGVVAADKMGYLKGMFSGASCVGLAECAPKVDLVGRVVTVKTKQPIYQADQLFAAPGSKLELSWKANNVQVCTAEGGWSRSSAIEHIEVLSAPITRDRSFTVTCYDKASNAYVTDTLSVSVAGSASGQTRE